MGLTWVGTSGFASSTGTINANFSALAPLTVGDWVFALVNTANQEPNPAGGISYRFDTSSGTLMTKVDWIGTGTAGAAGGPRVIVLTTYDSEADIIVAVETGACGYPLKDSPPEELIAAVRATASGQSALAPAITGRLIERIRIPARRLSTRETEVLIRVAAGMSNHQIASEVFVSQATISHPSCTSSPSSRWTHEPVAVAVAVQRGLIRHSDRPR